MTRILSPVCVWILLTFSSIVLPQDNGKDTKRWPQPITHQDSVAWRFIYDLDYDRGLLEKNKIYDTVRVLRNWRKLKVNLSDRQVRTLLGAPLRADIDTASKVEWWRYGPRLLLLNSQTRKLKKWFRFD